MTQCFIQDLDPVQGLVDYVLASKPYHTKIIEVLVEYIYQEDVKVTITEDYDWVVGMFQSCHSECVYKIIGASSVFNTFTIRYDFDGLLGENNPLGESAPLNLTNKFPVGTKFKIISSHDNTNDHLWTVQSTLFDTVTGDFIITTVEDIVDNFEPFGLLILSCADPVSAQLCDGFGISPFGSGPGVAICNIDIPNNQITLAGDQVCEFLNNEICLTLELFDSLATTLSGKINYFSTTYTGGPTTFILPFTILTTTVDRTPLSVFVNGVKQAENINYTITFPNTVNFTTLLLSTDVVEFFGYESVTPGINGPLYYRTTVITNGPGQSYILPFAIDPAPPGKTPLIVYVNGIKQTIGCPSPNVVVTPPNIITFTDILVSGDILEVHGNYGVCPTGSEPFSSPDYIKKYHAFVGNGVQTAFVLSSTIPFSGPSTQSLEAYINGVKQAPTEFTVTLGNTVTFSTAPGAGALIDIYVYNDCALGQPGFEIPDYYSVTGNGIMTVFAMPFVIDSVIPTKSELSIYANGVKQTRTVDYSITTPSTVTFTGPVLNGVDLEFYGITTPQYHRAISPGTSSFVIPFAIQLPTFSGQSTLEVFISGVKQTEGSSYTITFPSTVVFSSIIPPGIGVEFYGYNNCLAGTLLTPIVPDYNKKYFSATAVGGETVFVVPFVIPPPPLGRKTIDVYENGVKQTEGDAYFVTLPSTVTFFTPRVANANIDFYIYQDCSPSQPGTDFPLYHKVVPAVSTSMFTLPFSVVTPASGTSTIQVFVNGVKQIETAGYTITPPNIINLTTPAISGDVVEFFNVLHPRYHKTTYAGGPLSILLPFLIDAPFLGQSTLEVFVNGVKQRELAGYTISYPSTVVMDTLTTADVVEFYGYHNCLLTPSSSSVDVIHADFFCTVYAGGSTTFTLPFIVETPGPGEVTLEVYVNGVKQVVGVNYTITFPSTVVFTSLLLPNDVVEFNGHATNCPIPASGDPTFICKTCYTIDTIVLEDTDALTACIPGMPNTVITLVESIPTLCPGIPLVLTPTQVLGGVVEPGALDIVEAIAYSPAPLVPPSPFPDESAFLDIGSNMFVVDGNFVCRFCQGYRFSVVGGKDAGTYTALYADFVGGQTRIRVIEDIPFTGTDVGGQIKRYRFGYSEHREMCCDFENMCEIVRVVFREKLRFAEIFEFSDNVIAYDLENTDVCVSSPLILDVADGGPGVNAFIIAGRFANDFPAGFIFDVVGGPNPGTYTVVPAGTVPEAQNHGPGVLTLNILSASSATDTFVVAQDRTLALTPGSVFSVTMSAGNNGTYTTISSTYSIPFNETTITVATVPATTGASGNINKGRHYSHTTIPVVEPIPFTAPGGTIPYGDLLRPAVGAIGTIGEQSFLAAFGQTTFNLTTTPPVPGSNPALLKVTVGGLPAGFTLNTATQFTITSPAVNDGDLVKAVVRDMINTESNALVNFTDPNAVGCLKYHFFHNAVDLDLVNNAFRLYGGNFIPRFTKDRIIDGFIADDCSLPTVVPVPFFDYIKLYDSFTGDGVTTVFITSSTIFAPGAGQQSIEVYINGVKQEPTTVFIATPSNTITFTSPPPVSSIIDVYTYNDCTATQPGIDLPEYHSVISDGVTAAFIMPFTILPTGGGQTPMRVSINGVNQAFNDSFMVTLPNTVTFSSPPALGELVQFYGIVTTQYVKIVSINQAVFTLPFTLLVPSFVDQITLEVFVAGIKQTEILSYTITYPNIVTFVTPIPAGEIVEFYGLNNCQAVSPLIPENYHKKYSLFTGVSGVVVLTLPETIPIPPPGTKSIDVYLNGALQVEVDDYTTSGTMVSLVNPVVPIITPDNVEVYLYRDCSGTGDDYANYHTQSPTVPTDTFVLPFMVNSPIPGTSTLRVFINGIKQTDVLDYMFIPPNIVILVLPISAGDIIEFYGILHPKYQLQTYISGPLLVSLTFTIDTAFSNRSTLEVFLNGVKQVEGIDYVITTSTSVTFTSLIAGDIIEFYGYGPGSAPAFLGSWNPTSFNIIDVTSALSQMTVAGPLDWLFLPGAIFEVKYFDNNVQHFQVVTSILSGGNTIVTTTTAPFETIIAGVQAPFYSKDLGVITGAVFYPDIYTTVVVPQQVLDPNIDVISYTWITPMQLHAHNTPIDLIDNAIDDGLGISDRLLTVPDSFNIWQTDDDTPLPYSFTLRAFYNPSNGAVLVLRPGDPIPVLPFVPLDLSDSFTPGTQFRIAGSFNQINNYSSVIPPAGPPGTPIQGTPPAFPVVGDYWYDTSSYARAATIGNVTLSGLQPVNVDPTLTKNIQSASNDTDIFVIANDLAAIFTPGFTFDVINAAGNDGTYTVVSSTFASGFTSIAVTPGTITSTTGPVGQIIAVSLAVADRVLVKNQTIPAQNGVYVVSAGAWTRAVDFDTIAEFVNGRVTVKEGNALAITSWLANVSPSGTLGVSAILWSLVMKTIAPILSANSTTDVFVIKGNHTGVFIPGFVFNVADSTGNNGTYTTISSTHAVIPNETTISVLSVPNTTTSSGRIEVTDKEEVSAVLRQWSGSIWKEVFEFALPWTVSTAVFNSFTGETTITPVEPITNDALPFGRILREPVIVGQKQDTFANTSFIETLEFSWTAPVDWFQYMVICADTTNPSPLGNDTFTLLGNAISVIQPGDEIELISNNINNGVYTVSPSPLDGPFLDVNGNTVIAVTTSIPLGAGPPNCDFSNTLVLNRIGAGGFIEPLGGLGATLRFNDNVGVSTTEVADAAVLTEGQMIGGFDVPFWDLGGFDESLGELIHLYGNEF